MSRFETRQPLNSKAFAQKTADALTLGGSTIIGNGGTIAYDSNPNRIYLINTLVDRKYVDELVFNSIGLTGAANGLNTLNSTVRLGGSLDEDTTIDLNLHNLSLSNGAVNIPTINLTNITKVGDEMIPNLNADLLDGKQADEFSLIEHDHTGVYQPLDADLSAIAEISDDLGFLKKTGVDTWELAETGDKTFAFTQGVPSTHWIIIHDLNKLPSVSVIDTSSNEIEGEVRYISNSRVELHFSAAFGGTATLN